MGLDSQVLNLEARKLTKVRSTVAVDPEREQVVLVLANLAVRVDRRKSGIGKSLLASCDSFVEVGIYSYLSCFMTVAGMYDRRSKWYACMYAPLLVESG